MYAIRSKTVKIRKDRKCLLCFRPYPKGSNMHSCTVVDDGYIYTTHTCLTCEKLASNHYGYYDEFREGFMVEQMQECKVSSPEELLELLDKQVEEALNGSNI